MRGPLASALAPFEVKAFRYQWPSDILVSFALEMENLILGWYILAETRSVVMLTAFAGLQFAGSLLAPFIGVLGDRMGRRILLYGMRLVFASFAAVLMLLGLTGNLSPVAVFVVAFLAGLLRQSDLMLRLSLVSDMMPPGRLMAAMGLSRITLDAARVAGALTGAGLFAWLGFGASYVAVSAFYVASVLLMLGGARVAVRPVPLPGAQAQESSHKLQQQDARRAQSALRDLKDGLAHVRDTPRLTAIVWLAVLLNLVGFPLTAGLLPYVAREVYLLDEIGYGQLVAAHAFGCLAGSMLMTFLMRAFRAQRVVLAAAVLWHVAIIIFALTPTRVSGMAVLFTVGTFQSMTMVALSVALLGAAAERFRARVMGVRMLAVYGLPVGLLIAGYLIKGIGFVATISVFGVIGVVGTLLIGRRWRGALWA